MATLKDTPLSTPWPGPEGGTLKTVPLSAIYGQSGLALKDVPLSTAWPPVFSAPASLSSLIMADNPTAFWKLNELSGTVARDSVGTTGTIPTLPELLANPTFDAGITNWSGNGATISSDTVVKDTGAASLKAITGGSSLTEGAFSARTAALSVAPGSNYRASVRVNAPSGKKLKLMVEFRNSSDVWISAPEVYFTGTGAWQTVSQDIAAPAGADHAVFCVYTADTVAQAITFNVDNASLQILSSGSAHDGAMSGGPTLGNFSLFSNTTDKSILFDGVNDYITIPDHADFKGLTSFTIVAVVDLSSGFGNGDILTKKNNWYLSFDPADGFHVSAYTPAWSQIAGGLSYLVAGHAALVVAEYDGANLKLFVNGTQITSFIGSSAKTGTTASTTDPVCIGSYDGTVEFLKGALQYVAFFKNTAISLVRQQQYVTALGTLATGGVTPPPPSSAPIALSGTNIAGGAPKAAVTDFFVGCTYTEKFIREDGDATAWAHSNGLLVVGLCQQNVNAPNRNADIIEWDNEPYEVGGFDVSAFAVSAQSGLATLRAAFPTKRILLPVGPAWNGGYNTVGGSSVSSILAINNAAPGVWQYVDGIAVHPYSQPNPPVPGRFPVLDRWRSELKSIGHDIPFYVTEVGWPTGGDNWNPGGQTQQQQADYIAQFIDACRQRTDVALIMIYQPEDWGTRDSNSEHYFGMRNPDGSNKIAWASTRAKF